MNCAEKGCHHNLVGKRNPVELKDDFLHQRRLRNDRFGCAPCKGGAFQWVKIPPGNRSSRAIGAVMEVTKWLKPSISVSRIGDSASVQAATRVNVEQASKKDDVLAVPTAISGKADTAG